MSRKPHSSAVVIRRGDRFAAILSRKNGGTAEIPGGKMLSVDETPEQTAVREAREEVGLKVRIVQKICCVPINGYICHVFLATAAKGRLRSSSEGKAFWATREDLINGTYGKNVRIWLRALDALD